MSLKRSRNAIDAEDQQKKSSFVFYGTALPPQDHEVRDDGSYIPLWKQEVTDERGRKRLHGAFTGGFSAGYFNTVGSKEGWTPATFKSSRADRTKAAPARPEDFMDAEDLAEAEEARKIEKNSNFSGLGHAGDELARRGKQITLMDLLTPAVQDTMGVKLLKKMCWKEGQGIGPKTRREAQITDEGEQDNNALDGKMYLLAPKNPALVTFNRKTDSRGMGYVGEGTLGQREDKREEEEEDSRLVHLSTANPEKKLVKGGFGVGILNDDGEEDDPYEIRPKTAYNRVVGGEKLKKTSGPIVGRAAKHIFISKKAIKAKSSVNLRKCHDGRFPLGGFILSPDPIQSQSGWYLPPEIPSDWVSSGPGKSKTNKDQQKQPTQQAPVHYNESVVLKLNPRARGSMLGEIPLPGKSVFDFMTPAARERIASVTGNKNLPQALGEAPPSTFPSSNPSSLADLVPKLDKNVALGALRGGFIPYSDDPDKKARYRSFLEVQAGLNEGLPDRKHGMNTQDWIKELNEFMGAARIFKPLTGLIATRFTSSTTTASAFEGGSPAIASHDPSTLLHRPTPKPEDPGEAAAKMSMYGPVTRSIIEFFPTRLLCKRFNVKPPDHVNTTGEGGVGVGGWGPTGMANRDLVSKGKLTEIMRAARGDEDYVLPEEVKSVAPRVDTETNEALEGERAGEEVFKAIFGDSDEEDE